MKFNSLFRLIKSFSHIDNHICLFVLANSQQVSDFPRSVWSLSVLFLTINRYRIINGKPGYSICTANILIGLTWTQSILICTFWSLLSPSGPWYDLHRHSKVAAVILENVLTLVVTIPVPTVLILLLMTSYRARQHLARFAEEEKTRARFAEEEETRARFAEGEETRARFAEGEETRARFAEAGETRARFAEEEKTRARFAEEEETRARFAEEEKSRARFAEEEETRARFAEEEETRPLLTSPQMEGDLKLLHAFGRRGRRRKCCSGGVRQYFTRRRRRIGGWNPFFPTSRKFKISSETLFCFLWPARFACK